MYWAILTDLIYIFKNEGLLMKTDKIEQIILQLEEICTQILVRKKLAKLAGVSYDTLLKVEKILETASPEEIEKARSGEVSINQMYNIIRRKEKEEQRNLHIKENDVDECSLCEVSRFCKVKKGC
jgi:hypothetical protein